MSNSLAAIAETTLRSDTSIRFAARPPNAFVERTATIPGLSQPLVYGVRAPFHDTYHVAPGEFAARPTTNDVFIASVGACMAGTFGGMLVARGIDLTSENCTIDVQGEIATPDDGDGHYVRRIHVEIRISGIDDPQQRAAIDRVQALVHRQCWLSQTLAGSRCEVSLSVEHAAA